jgi:hypothetical protein
MADDAGAKRRRSGTETRRRTDVVNLRLLPSEAVALRDLAKQHGHPSVQALIVDVLRPLLATVGCGEFRGSTAVVTGAGP